MKTKTKSGKNKRQSLTAVITKITAPTSDSLKRAAEYLRQCSDIMENVKKSEMTCQMDPVSPFNIRCTIH